MTDSDLETDHTPPRSVPVNDVNDVNDVNVVNAETQTPPSQADISADRDVVSSGTEDADVVSSGTEDDDELNELLDSIVGSDDPDSERSGSETGYDSSVESSRDGSDHSSVCSDSTELFMEQYTDTVKSVEKSLYKVIRHLIQNNPDDDTLRIAAYLQYVIDNKISTLL